MKKIFLIIFGLFLYSLVHGQTVTYTCPMHPKIHATKPGNCPECGMKLVEEKPKQIPKTDDVPTDTTMKNPPIRQMDTLIKKKMAKTKRT